MTFLNLSNHPLPTWSEDQLSAARALGHGEPVELKGGMPLVPSDATEDDVRRLATDVAQRAAEQGAAGAFVASDFTFAFRLVSELKARGIRCYSATTERQAHEEVATDGSVLHESVFRFVRWREYV